MEKVATKNAVALSKENSEKADIEPELQRKHPLQNVWDLWFYKNLSNNYEENLCNITSIDTVEDFWGFVLIYFYSFFFGKTLLSSFFCKLSVYHNIEDAGKLAANCAYYFFKKGIRPMWEDDTNKEGGRWIFITMKKNSSNQNNYWLEIVSQHYN